jgi:hypothetical protein
MPPNVDWLELGALEELLSIGASDDRSNPEPGTWGELAGPGG